MIVVATDNFRLYHALVRELRARDMPFTTIEPGAELPEDATVLIAGPEDELAYPQADLDRVTTTAAEAQLGVERAVRSFQERSGRKVLGIDPGARPGIAVLRDEQVVSVFQVPLDETVETIRREIADSPNPILRIGDGDRLRSARLVNEFETAQVELVDETATTPRLGTGTRGMGDVLAAVNIALLGGEPVDSRDVEPTGGEIQRIQNESRERSDGSRTIDETLARKVAAGELTIDEALERHRTS